MFFVFICEQAYEDQGCQTDIRLVPDRTFFSWFVKTGLFESTKNLNISNT